MRKSENSSRPKKDSSRSASSRSDRPSRPSSDKPSFRKREDDKPFRSATNRSERPTRSGDDKPSFRKREDDRGGYSSRPPRFSEDRPYRSATNRSDRPTRSGDDKPAFRKREDDRGGYSSRPPRFSEDRPYRSASNRSERLTRSGDDKPAFRKREDDRGGYSSRPPRFSEDRPYRSAPNRSDRPTRDSDDKPSFRKREDDRGGYSSRPPRFSEDRPYRSAPNRSDRPARDSDDKPTFRKREDDRGGYSSRPPRFSEDKPYRSAPNRSDRPTRDSDEKPARRSSRFDSKENQATSSKKYAPRYDFDKIKENLPEKVQKRVLRKEREESNEIRLNRYIANAGIASRRDADELIASGQITVNGKEITEMGYKVKPDDIVKYGKKVLNREKMVYLLLNKPKDFITTTEDPEERHTVMDLVANACEERIYPVGRLDRNTTGLLLLTNDGELAEKLSHPSNEIKKIYQVELDKPFTEEHFEMMKKGFELEDGMIKADELSIITPDAEVVGIEIHSGRNRIVRRMFEHLGYEVLKLDRTTYAGLTKKDLPRSKWRFLTEKEVIRLKYML